MIPYTSRRTLTGVSAAGHKKLHRAPDAAIDELIRAYAQPRTLTAFILGDPLPGRSALDKQRMNLAEPPAMNLSAQVGLSNP